MALRWDWKDKMGECIHKNGRKANLYAGNCLAIAVYEGKDGYYSLAWFFADEKHMKSMLGLTKEYKGQNTLAETGIVKIRLNTNYKDVPKIVSAFARAKMEINIELYKEETK